MTEDQVQAETARAVARARSYSDDVEFSPEDAQPLRPRTSWSRSASSRSTTGATTLNIPDTVGYGDPRGVRRA